jgi:hypothetical protein
MSMTVDASYEAWNSRPAWDSLMLRDAIGLLERLAQQCEGWPCGPKGRETLESAARLVAAYREACEHREMAEVRC